MSPWKLYVTEARQPRPRVLLVGYPPAFSVGSWIKHRQPRDCFDFDFRLKTTATSSLISSSFPLPTKPLTIQSQTQHHNTTSFRKRAPFKVLAAKLPAGVEVPKVEPKFKASFLGLTRKAEIWNSRASMIGSIGIFIVEIILNKGILQMIGVDVGKGLDLPL